jgi:hypothetical protein
MKFERQRKFYATPRELPAPDTYLSTKASTHKSFPYSKARFIHVNIIWILSLALAAVFICIGLACCWQGQGVVVPSLLGGCALTL